MRNLAKNVSLAFAAGCLGGLVNSLVVWLFVEFGVTSALGVKIGAPMTPAWLYPRVVWGGRWGFLFLLPLLKNRTFARGVALSLGPTLFQLFVVFPYWLHKGVMGLDLGTGTPLFVIFFNAVWGAAASQWLRWSGR